MLLISKNFKIRNINQINRQTKNNNALNSYYTLKKQMIPTRNSFSYSDSRYHQKKQKILYEFLMSSFGYTEMLASLIIAVHDCNDMAELMSLFVLDDQGKYAHIFVPDVAGPTPKCRACGQGKSSHSNQVTWEQLKKFEEQLQKNESPLDFLQQQKLHARSFSSDDQGLSKLYKNLQKEESLMHFFEDPAIKKQGGEKYFTCTICYASFLGKHDMVTIKQKTHELCLNCMAEYLKQEIINLRIEEMKCPHCGELITPDIVKQYVNSTLFEKYQTFLHNLQIQKNPNFKWCPNPKCSVVISVSKDKKGVIKCPKCQTEVCIKCNREAHPKRSCDDVLKDVFKDLENASDIQKCKKCRALVEKIAGCNHMTCGVCRYQWCWLCGSTYSDIHFSPLNPLGCAGMQNRNMSGCSKCKIFVLRILMIIGFLILFPIVAPVAMVFCGPVLLYNFLSKKICYTYNCCLLMLIAIISLPLGLIADPFIWIGGIIYFTPALCRSIGNWVQRRRNMNEVSQNQIKRRLLSEGQHVVVSAS